MGEWEEVALSDLCSAVVDCPHSTPIWTESGVVVLRNQNIRDGRLDLSAPSFTDEAHYQDRIKRAAPEPGDLVITREAPMGQVCMIPDGLRCCLGQRMVLLRPEPAKVNGRYLAYALQSREVQHEIGVNEGTGSTVSNVRLPILRSLPIPCPPKEDQEAIAHILGSLDDKIELNRRMNETLEAMARALFKSWFVDFDPVRAKAEGRDPGLPEELAGLFPDRLVESKLGEIPEGWKVGCFGDIAAEVREGESPMASPDVMFHHYSIPAFDQGRSSALELGATIKSNKWVVPPGVVLVSKLNPEIDRVWLVDVAPGDRAVCSTEFLVLESRAPFERTYLYCQARSTPFRRELQGMVTGTSKSHQRVRPASLMAIPVLLPPEPVLDAFARCSASWLESTLERQSEAYNLALLRDALLPKLISGELRVTAIAAVEAEKVM
jgi:type I restriction enzyme, S subunit